MSEFQSLPKGWLTAKIEEVTLPQETCNPARDGSGSGTFHYVDIDALDNHRHRIMAAKVLKKSEAPSRARVSIHAGDVLFSLVRPYLKNIAVVQPELDGEVASTAYCALRPATGIDSRFLFYQVVQESFIHSVPTYGNSPPAARDEEFFSQIIRMAPANEQRRIAERIDELLSRLDAGIENLEKVRQNLGRYRASVLKAAVEGKLTERWRREHPDVEPASKLLQRILQERRRRWGEEQLAKFRAKGHEPPRNWQDKYEEPKGPDLDELPELPKGWCWATIEQLSEGARPISYGVLQPGPDLLDGVPLIRVCDVNDGKIAEEQLKRIASRISNQYQRTLI